MRFVILIFSVSAFFAIYAGKASAKTIEATREWVLTRLQDALVQPLDLNRISSMMYGLVSDRRIAERADTRSALAKLGILVQDVELSLCSGKPKSHLGELIPVVVELSDGNAKVFGDLLGQFVGLSPDLNNHPKQTRKAVALHEKTIDFNRFKVKAKMGCSAPTTRLIG